MGFGLVIGPIDQLYTPLETTSNYNATANLDTLHCYTHTLVFSDFTSRILAIDVNGEDFFSFPRSDHSCPANIPQLKSLNSQVPPESSWGTHYTA
jgi:hypothetical protein